MIDNIETAALELCPDDLTDVVGGTGAGGISKLGSRRLILEGDGAYAGAGATLQLAGSITIAGHEDLL